MANKESRMWVKNLTKFSLEFNRYQPVKIKSITIDIMCSAKFAKLNPERIQLRITA